MNDLLFFVIVCLILLSSSPIHGKKKQDTVKLALYYESYCPYSIDFMNNQLYPVWEEFRDYMEVYLIPFGNAEQIYVDGHFVFECQHGVEECAANILHACAIYQACEGTTTLHCSAGGLARAMSYVNCLMEHYDQQRYSKKCAKESMISEGMIDMCSDGWLGNYLESYYGNVTEAHIHPSVSYTPFIVINGVSIYIHPSVSYTPFIVINGEHNEVEQYAAQLDLRLLICSYIPDQCTSNLQPL